MQIRPHPPPSFHVCHNFGFHFFAVGPAIGDAGLRHAELLPDHRRRLPELIPLAWSIPSFSPHSWREAEIWLRSLQALSFRWVTLHPTYAVRDSGQPEIDVSYGPPISETLTMARDLGLKVRLEPHLDWQQTLSGGSYEWRRRMYINPAAQYLEQILAPLAQLKPDEFTLGSELDVSAYEFAKEWERCAGLLRPLGSMLGHKLNHDWRSARTTVLNEANLERSRRSLPARWSFGYGRELSAYLASLDYVAVSYYPSGKLDLEPDYTIGEFGLGSTDVTRPWHFDSETFRTPEDFAIRTDYYLRFLAWLKTRDSGRAASFWTTGHFDVLGIMQSQWRDETIAEAVIAYNQASP